MAADEANTLFGESSGADAGRYAYEWLYNPSVPKKTTMGLQGGPEYLNQPTLLTR